MACCAILIAGSTVAYPQQPKDPDPAGQQPPAAEQNTKAAVVSGTVKAYEAGKSIEITAKDGPKTYDLTASGMTVTISPDVKIGSKVKVTEKSDGAGHKTVSIDPQ